MTLATDIYITGTGATMREVYEKVNDLLDIPSTRRFTETPTGIRNDLGQGFPAIVDVSAGVDGALVVPEHDAKWCEEDCDSHRCTESYHVHVDLDTAYSYRDQRGWDCSRLHAYVILSLAGWLADKGCTVRWVNEYAGTIHDANDEEAFKKFLGSGDEAGAWFRETVVPAILAEHPSAVIQ